MENIEFSDDAIQCLVNMVTIDRALARKTDAEIIELFLEYVWADFAIGSPKGELCSEIMHRFADGVGYDFEAGAEEK